jgi:hypothetical protein
MKLRLPIIIAMVLALAAASYVAVSLIATGSVGLGALQLPGVGGNGTSHFQVIQPTEVPQTLPDMVGPVVAIQDQDFTVQSHSKGRVDPNGPRTEIVIAADTKVYQDVNNRDTSSVVDGKLQMRVAPYAYKQIKVGDVLMAWGNQRGERLVADAIIVEVNIATPTP